VPVLLLGETGTGKELVAAAIHALSGRKGDFVPVNCAAIPEQLAEGELFGHVKGAFTGAIGESGGLFRAADGGTLLLDEIGEMPASLQPKLLRALATGEVRRVGETTARKVDVRVVAATHVDLLAAAQDQRFRPDLLARLAGHVVRIAPLRERREDILSLASYFLAKASEQRIERNTHERVARSFSPDAAEALLVHEWQFNVRGLEQAMRVAATRVPEGKIELAGLGPGFRASLDGGRLSPVPGAAASRVRALEVRPDAVPSADELRAVIEHFEGRIGRIAAFFGKERRQIYRWAERYEIDLASARDE
jgi:DNA-binding NtrC family response regulator